MKNHMIYDYNIEETGLAWNQDNGRISPARQTTWRVQL